MKEGARAPYAPRCLAALLHRFEKAALLSENDLRCQRGGLLVQIDAQAYPASVRLTRSCTVSGEAQRDR